MVSFFVGCILIAVGSVGFIKYFQAYFRQGVVSSSPVTTSATNPDEVEPTTCDGYSVGSDEPHTLLLPSLGVSGCIQKVGIDEMGRIAAPTNIHVAGWYVQSVVPGTKGLSIIDGHLSGKYKDGIFARLHELKAGDGIQIRTVEGTVKEFEVVDTSEYTMEEAQEALYEILDDVESQLTLITCGGEYDTTQENYTQRTIVRARLVHGEL